MQHKMLPSGPVVALASVLGLAHCHSPQPVAPASPDSVGDAPAATASSGSAQPPATAAGGSNTAAATGGSPATAAAPAEPGTTHNTANDMIESHDDADLALFKRIEHDTKRDVPAVVRALVTSKHQGAIRQALVSEIDKSVDDAKLRSLLNQWLDESFGVADGPKTPAPGTSAGTAPSKVKPLKGK